MVGGWRHCLMSNDWLFREPGRRGNVVSDQATSTFWLGRCHEAGNIYCRRRKHRHIDVCVAVPAFAPLLNFFQNDRNTKATTPELCMLFFNSPTLYIILPASRNFTRQRLLLVFPSQLYAVLHTTHKLSTWLLLPVQQV